MSKVIKLLDLDKSFIYQLADIIIIMRQEGYSFESIANLMNTTYEYVTILESRVEEIENM